MQLRHSHTRRLRARRRIALTSGRSSSTRTHAASALWVASTTRRQVTPDSVSAMSNATEVIDTTQLVAPASSEVPGTDDLMTSPLSVGGVAQVWTSRMWRPSTSVGWTVRETSPMGRASVSPLDLDGRVTDTTPPVITQDGATLTLHPTHVEYGSHGRIATVTRGARVVSYGYYGDSEPPSRRGRVHTVTVGTTTPSDPTSVVTFSYDEGGVARSSRVAAPSGAAVDTVVDEHGNVTSITPPGRSAHVFAYGLRDRLSAYQPPPASGTSVTPWQTTYDTPRQTLRFASASSGVLAPTLDARPLRHRRPPLRPVYPIATMLAQGFRAGVVGEVQKAQLPGIAPDAPPTDSAVRAASGG